MARSNGTCGLKLLKNRAKARAVVGEISTDEMFLKISEVAPAVPRYDLYEKCTCKECGRNFKYRADSLEGYLGTCPWCGFANAREERTKSLNDAIQALCKSMKNSSNIEDSVLGNSVISERIGITMTKEVAEEALMNWPRIREELSKYAVAPLTVKCNEDWTEAEDQEDVPYENSEQV